MSVASPTPGPPPVDGTDGIVVVRSRPSLGAQSRAPWQLGQAALVVLHMSVGDAISPVNGHHLTSGTLAILHVREARRLQFEAGAEGVALLLGSSALDRDWALLDSMAGATWSSSDGSARLIASLLEASRQSDSVYVPADFGRFARHIAGLVVMLCLDRPDASAHFHDALYDRAIAEIDARLTDGRASSAVIAAAINVSPRTLQRVFSRRGTSVAAYLRQRRLEASRDELLGTDLPVHQIAARWGYWNPTHFSRSFRQAFGASPTEIRTQRDGSHRRTRAR